ncbi:MAG: 50S ribosomal protein L22 [Thermoplasmata archaeon]|nr:50S ribosomal protein L22 [Thermoplasmata archaeon]
MGYTFETDPKKHVKAYGKELPISPKKSYEICNAIRGMLLPEAEKFLENVIALKQPVKIKRYTYGAPHKKGYGPARYPVKPAKYILKVLKEARANAESLEIFDPDNMRVKVISASRGTIQKGYMPRAHGRSTPWHEQTTNIEIILEQMEE